ncbi:hypothetical protein BO71DRAFT_308881, partial [Aspergillus ellipticus CBS 707.79]
IPQGWTNDPFFIDDFFKPDSVGSDLAEAHGLDNPQILLVTAPPCGETGFLFSSGKHFIWGDMLGDYIYEVTKPRGLGEILRVMDEVGERGLRVRRVR